MSSTLESLWSKARADDLEKLDYSKCRDEYATSIQSNRRNLLLVLDDSDIPSPANDYSMNGSLAYWVTKFETYDWLSPKKGSLTFEWICSALDDRSTPCSVLVKNLKKEPWIAIVVTVLNFCKSQSRPVSRYSTYSTELP